MRCETNVVVTHAADAIAAERTRNAVSALLAFVDARTAAIDTRLRTVLLAVHAARRLTDAAGANCALAIELRSAFLRRIALFNATTTAIDVRLRSILNLIRTLRRSAKPVRADLARAVIGEQALLTRITTLHAIGTAAIDVRFLSVRSRVRTRRRQTLQRRAANLFFAVRTRVTPLTRIASDALTTAAIDVRFAAVLRAVTTRRCLTDIAETRETLAIERVVARLQVRAKRRLARVAAILVALLAVLYAVDTRRLLALAGDTHRRQTIRSKVALLRRGTRITRRTTAIDIRLRAVLHPVRTRNRYANAARAYLRSAIHARIALLPIRTLLRTRTTAIDVRLTAVLDPIVRTTHSAFVNFAVAVVIDEIARLLGILERLDVGRADRTRQTRYFINAAAGFAEFAQTRKFALAIQTKTLRIVFQTIAVIVETIAHFGARKDLRETLHLIKFATFAREIPLLADADAQELVVERMARLRLIIGTLAPRDLVRQTIAIVIETVTNLAARNDVRLAIPPESTDTALQTRLAVRYAKRPLRTAITFSLLTFGTRTRIIHCAVAVVIKIVIAVFEVRKNLARAIAPHPVRTNLDARNAHADVARQRCAAVAILHLRIHAGATLVNQPIAVVVDAVANLVRRRSHLGTLLRQTVHTCRQHHLARTHATFERR